MTSESVRQAAARPDLNHRQPEYAELFHDLRKRLLSVYDSTVTGWTPYLIGGSGTAAVEAMVTSCIADGRVLVIANGYYSRRIADIAAAHHIPHDVLNLPWEHLVNVEMVRKALDARDYEAVLMTHDETTLGFLNPIAEVGKLCRERGVRLLVDAMSSFGADDIDFSLVDAVASSANKCLHGLPGVAFVLGRDSLADWMETLSRRTFYLHLPMYRPEVPPLTPSIPVLRAFHQALIENPNGQVARKAQYQVKDAFLRQELAALGLRFAVPPACASLSTLSVSVPTGWSYDEWFDANYRAGFVLYGTKKHLRERFFQVSPMGETTMRDLEAWIKVAQRLMVNGH